MILAAKRAREINSYYNQLGEGRGEFVPPLVETGLHATSRSRSPSKRSPKAKIDVRAHRGPRRIVGSSTLVRAGSGRRDERTTGRCSASPEASRRTRPRSSPALLTGRAPDVTVVMTEAATRFVGPDTFAALTGRPVHTSLWERPGEVLHVRLAHDADVVVVAPATANLAGQARARGSPTTCSPRRSSRRRRRSCRARDAHRHVGAPRDPGERRGRSRCAGSAFVGPVEGALAHGDSGHGPARRARGDRCGRRGLAARSTSPGPVDDNVVPLRSGDLSERLVVVTAGPTYEPIDPVRFIGNRSSGKMGVRDRRRGGRARRRGPSGPGAGDGRPASGEPVRVTTAEEMRAARVRGSPIEPTSSSWRPRWPTSARSRRRTAS